MACFDVANSRGTPSTDFNFIQESLIESQPVIPMVPPTSLPMGIGGPSPAPVPVSLASMDSAVMMVHSQVPPGHLAAYSFMSGNPAAASSLYQTAPIISAAGPASTLPTAELITEPARTASPVTAQVDPTPQVNTASANATTTATATTSSSTWAEEPQDDMPPFQQEQNNRTESNTWTNSNYRSNDQGDNLCPQLPYRCLVIDCDY